MNVAVVEGMAEPNLPVDEETLYMNESHLIPIPIQRGVLFLLRYKRIRSRILQYRHQ